jgi:phospholipase C
MCGSHCIDVSSDDANCGACAVSCTEPQHCAAGLCAHSKIEHVVLIVQENHTFDSYFGHYCQAAAYSSPTCTQGSACCEAAPATDPNGLSPIVLDDAANLASDPNHSQACELQEIDGGAMNGFTAGSGIGSSICDSACSRAGNFAIAGEQEISTYWSYAQTYALADRYFQPIAGSSSSNDMYFASAHVEFIDNALLPASIGSGCSDPIHVCTTGSKSAISGATTIGDLLLGANHTFGVYADGYANSVSAGSGCASVPDSCPYDLLHPILRRGCLYDPSDIPFEYFDQFTDDPVHMHDYADFATALDAGTLPSFAYIKAMTYRNEHPEFSKISDGVQFVSATVEAVLASSYAANTLVLVTWDEGGGFFDHIAPPPSVDSDDAGVPVPHGTRVPLLAIGRFARTNTVSHVVMYHSSVVRFLEYNFVGPVGGLHAADARVNNLGSLLDPAQTGIPIPE